MRELRAAEITTKLSTYASVDVGIVTGKNSFFVLNESQVKELGLYEYAIPLISRSTQLKGTLLGKADWKALSSYGDRVYLLNVKEDTAITLSEPLRSYIQYGESQEYHRGYKCSIRYPWYSVPSIWSPDGFVFRQIYDFPRTVLNSSGATSTDTIHRLSCKIATPYTVVSNMYTWLTAASAEIEGRSYGGGVLELEPTEAERLMMPAKLNGAMSLVDADRLIRLGRLDAVLEENGKVVLQNGMGLSRVETFILKNIWQKMKNRRMTRRKGLQEPSGARSSGSFASAASIGS